MKKPTQKAAAKKAKTAPKTVIAIKRGVVKAVKPKAGFGDNVKGTAKKPKAGTKAKEKGKVKTVAKKKSRR